MLTELFFFFFSKNVFIFRKNNGPVLLVHLGPCSFIKRSLDWLSTLINDKMVDVTTLIFHFHF